MCRDTHTVTTQTPSHAAPEGPYASEAPPPAPGAVPRVVHAVCGKGPPFVEVKLASTSIAAEAPRPLQRQTSCALEVVGPAVTLRLWQGHVPG
jgi:hypothetical protein